MFLSRTYFGVDFGILFFFVLLVLCVCDPTGQTWSTGPDQGLTISWGEV